MDVRELRIGMNAKKPVLGMGADADGSLCLVKGKKALLMSGFGDLSEYKSYVEYTKAARKLAEDKPLIVCDLNPGFFSAKLAHKLVESPVKVQHHLAHAYAVALEHNLKDFRSIICDGFGLGSDNKAWGGEVFDNLTRIGSLEEHPLPGGDAATLKPERFLMSMLRHLNTTKLKQLMINYLSEEEFEMRSKQLSKDYNSIMTTSTGRVLDAGCYLLGFCNDRQEIPPVVLEKNSSEPYKLKPEVADMGGRKVLLTGHLMRWVYDHLNDDLPDNKQRLAGTVQRYIVEGLFGIAGKQKPVVFGGGCAVNKLMSGFLEKKGVLLSKDISPGDAGISFGQVGYVLWN